MAKKKPTFEEALQSLEAIADHIEKGDVGLEESVDRYEEGMRLVRLCRDRLAKAEQRIQKISERADGSLQTADFQPKADE